MTDSSILTATHNLRTTTSHGVVSSAQAVEKQMIGIIAAWSLRLGYCVIPLRCGQSSFGSEQKIVDKEYFKQAECRVLLSHRREACAQWRVYTANIDEDDGDECKQSWDEGEVSEDSSHFDCNPDSGLFLEIVDPESRIVESELPVWYSEYLYSLKS